MARSLLAVGWNEDAAAALRALSATGGYQPVAILDRSGMSLVSARRATGLACSQFVGQGLDSSAYDAVLLASAEHAAEDAARAASRGATLLAVRDALGPALGGVIEAARTHDVPLHLLRPALQDPGIAGLLQATWRQPPSVLDISVEAPADRGRLLAIAASLVSRLAPGADQLTVVATGAPGLTAATIGTDSWFASLRVRHAPAALVRIAGSGDRLAFDLRIEDGIGSLVLHDAERGRSMQVRPAGDSWLLEAERVACALDDDMAAACADDALFAAVSGALDAEVEAPAPSVRPSFQVLRGSGNAPTPPRRALRLVHAP